MPVTLSREERTKRKSATVLDFSIQRDEEGNVLNPKVISKAVQSKKKECDINRIVKRAINKDGSINQNVVNAVAKTPGRFGDFTNAPDFQEAQDRVNKMNEEFMALDPQVRKRFNNNPSELVEFLYDPKNKEEAIELGLLPKPVKTVKKLETPEGSFWVHYSDDVETGRTKIEATPPAPEA
jgi:phage internal scaffolding protein